MTYLCVEEFARFVWVLLGVVLTLVEVDHLPLVHDAARVRNDEVLGVIREVTVVVVGRSHCATAVQLIIENNFFIYQ